MIARFSAEVKGMINPVTHETTVQQVSRRWFLRDCAVGLGSLALADLLNPSAYASGSVRTPPITPRAKRVVYLFMAGAPSHLELFDYKPSLVKYDGTLPPPKLIEGYRAAFITPNSKFLGPR